MQPSYSHSSPFFFVLNRASGHHDAGTVEAGIRQTLDRAGRDYELLRVRHPRQLVAMARKAVALATDHGGVVGVVGGDGTISAVVQEVLPTGLPLAALPQGTFNFFGRCHRLPLGDPAQAMAALLHATIKPVQVGLVNDRVFLVNASLGLYPDLLQLRELHKRRFGRYRWVALGSGLMALLGRYPRMHLRLHDGHGVTELAATTLVVGNNALQLEQLGVPEAAAVGQGRLVRITVPPTGKLRMLATAVMGLSGHLDAGAAQSSAFTELHVDLRRRKVKLALDGEIDRFRTPLHFRAAPQLLQLLVPAAAEAPT